MDIINNLFEKIKSDNTIDSFEIITLHTSGMRFVTEHEIVVKDGKAEISQYGIRFSNEEDRRVLEKRAMCSIDEVLKLLNDCNILSWNGFDGPHPKNVLDGTMFNLNAIVNGNIKISAKGSQNFPKHYREFTDGIYHFLNDEEKYKEEAKQKWGETAAYSEYTEKTKNYSKDKWNNLSEELNGIFAEFATCMKNGKATDDIEVQDLVKALKNHITENYYKCTDDILKELGQMYVGDERFKNNIDKHAEGTAEYVCKAIEVYCGK